nr:MAG TPA: hypothetical protein [Bacteriophage sp.]
MHKTGRYIQKRAYLRFKFRFKVLGSICKNA